MKLASLLHVNAPITLDQEIFRPSISRLYPMYIFILDNKVAVTN